MNISSIFIRRPVATILLAVAMTAAGLFAYSFLPVAALPRVDFPVIVVSAQLPGASPDTMANSVATPLIKEFSLIPAIDSISATSNQGFTRITIVFELNRNIDEAAADVQAAIARTARRMPSGMTTPPSYRKVNPADSPILLLMLQSDRMPLPELDAFAEQIISPTLSTITGVGDVQVFGSQKYAVRIQLDPDALIARGIGYDQVVQAVAVNNSIAPVGTVSNDAQRLTIQADTQMGNADAFRRLIIATKGGHIVRLGDVAHVVDSVENTETGSWYDGKRSLLLPIWRQPDANTVEVIDRIKGQIPRFLQDLGPGARINVLIDRSTSILDAIADVQYTLLLTIGAIVLVIFLFLRRVTSTVIPTLAVPISLIATYGAMYAFHYSIDNVSLLGLTLSVGLVVDDAIVMLENIVRHIEQGKKPFQAALDGSREVGFTIVSITLSLVAVFIPVLLMGGVVGRIFNEFAVIVTIAIIASAVVSLTLTPMLCSHLPSRVSEHTGGVLGLFEAGFDALFRGYRAMLDFCLRAKPVVFLVFLGTVVYSAHLFMTIPKGFFPREDLGQLTITTEARQDVSFEAMAALQEKAYRALISRPYVEHVGSSLGMGGFGRGLNQGRMFVDLKPQDERPPLSFILGDLRRTLGQVPGIRSFIVPIQNLRVGGHLSKSEYQFVVQGLESAELYGWSKRLMSAMEHDPHFIDVTTDLEDNAIQAQVVIDRDKARALGVTADQLRSTLYAGFGTQQISTIYKTGDNYDVIVELDPKIAWSADKLDAIRIRSAQTGALIPLSTIAHVERTAGLLSVNQIGQLPAVTLSFNLPNGVSLGQAIDRIDAIKADLHVPSTITTGFSGAAQIFQDALANQGLLLFAAILTIYIVLGILYESFIHPLTILTGLPAAGMGALLALELFHFDLSVIAIIGVLMLIGIVKKNAIMMIDFALVRRRAGAPAYDAIREACLIRFRPIMMTSMAAFTGALLIAVGVGTSSELRQPLGVAVAGGLLVSQVLTLFITPVIYLYMEGLSDALKRAAVRALPRRRPPEHPEPGAAE